jgi:hypothetical protein
MTSKPPRTPAVTRNRALVALDAVAGIVLTVLGIVLGFAVVTTAGLYPQNLATHCCGTALIGQAVT